MGFFGQLLDIKERMDMILEKATDSFILLESVNMG